LRGAALATGAPATSTRWPASTEARCLGAHIGGAPQAPGESSGRLSRQRMRWGCRARLRPGGAFARGALAIIEHVLAIGWDSLHGVVPVANRSRPQPLGACSVEPGRPKRRRSDRQSGGGQSHQHSRGRRAAPTAGKGMPAGWFDRDRLLFMLPGDATAAGVLDSDQIQLRQSAWEFRGTPTLLRRSSLRSRRR
jgi:hypothetical protein